MQLAQDLRNVIKQYGPSVISEDRIVGILMDMKSFRSFPALKNIVKYIVSNGYSNRFLNLSEAQKHQTIKEIAFKTGYDSSHIKYVIDCFVYGLKDDSILPPTPQQNNKDNTKKKKSYFKYLMAVGASLLLMAILFLTLNNSNNKPLFRIQENGLYGFINSDGKVKIEPQYKYVGKFTEDGYACVISSIRLIKRSKDGLFSQDSICLHYGYINKNNEYIVDTSNVLTIPLDLLDAEYLIENAEEFVSKFNETQFAFRDYFFDELSLRSKRFVYQDPNSKLLGYKDLDGNIAITPKYEYCRSFNSDVAFVLDTVEHSRDMQSFSLTDAVNRFSLVDKNGSVIKSKAWCSANDFTKNGKTWVKMAKVEITDDGNISSLADYFQIDTKGNTLIGPIGVLPQAFISNNESDGLYVYIFPPTMVSDVKYTYITQDGKFATDYNNDEELSIWSESGEKSEVFDDATRFGNGYAGVRIYETNNDESIPRWAFINKDMEIKEDQVYDSIVPFNEGLCPVKQATPIRGMGQWGVLNTYLDLVIPYKFSEIGRFNNGLAYALISGSGVDREGYINKQGEFVWSTNRKK